MTSERGVLPQQSIGDFMTFKTIVAAVGYADEAEKVVRQAKYIADKHRAKLILIHAVETVHIIAGPEAYGYVEMVPDADEAKAAAVKNILQIIQMHGKVMVNKTDTTKKYMIYYVNFIGS